VYSQEGGFIRRKTNAMVKGIKPFAAYSRQHETDRKDKDIGTQDKNVYHLMFLGFPVKYVGFRFDNMLIPKTPTKPAPERHTTLTFRSVQHKRTKAPSVTGRSAAAQRSTGYR
jgi:hypothetical protein